MSVGVVFITACEVGGTPNQPSPSPIVTSPTASNSIPLAVYDGPTLRGDGHVIYIVGIGDYGAPNCQPDCRFAANETAKVLHTVEAAARNIAPAMARARTTPTDFPYVTTSKTHVFFLDGDARLRAFGSDAKIKDVTMLPATPSVHAAFAVTADEARIAVALIDYSTQPVSETLYVSKLDGSGRSDLLKLAGPYYWPVGWHDNKILLATGSVFSDGSAPSNQYAADGYAWIDPNSPAPPSALGTGDCVPTGSLSPAGTACISNPGSRCAGNQVGTNGASAYYSSCLRRVDWSGKETTFLLTGAGSPLDFAAHHAALSNDGRVIMTDGLFWVAEPGPGGYPGFQGGFSYSAPFNALPDRPGIGWIDSHHVSFLFLDSRTGASYQRIYSLPAGYGEVKNVYFEGTPADSYVPGGSVVGQLMGTLPGGL